MSASLYAIYWNKQRSRAYRRRVFASAPSYTIDELWGFGEARREGNYLDKDDLPKLKRLAKKDAQMFNNPFQEFYDLVKKYGEVEVKILY